MQCTCVIHDRHTIYCLGAKSTNYEGLCLLLPHALLFQTIPNPYRISRMPRTQTHTIPARMPRGLAAYPFSCPPRPCTTYAPHGNVAHFYCPQTRTSSQTIPKLNSSLLCRSPNFTAQNVYVTHLLAPNSFYAQFN